MKRVLITGMSGTGKSSVIRELTVRGFKAVDTDYDGFSILVDALPGELTGLNSGQDWVWEETRIQELLSTEPGDILFLSGCAPNQGKFYPQFDHVILLSAPADVLVERLAARTSNPYGKRPEEIERVLALQQTIEPLLRKGADLEIDTSIALDKVIERVLDHIC